MRPGFPFLKRLLSLRKQFPSFITTAHHYVEIDQFMLSVEAKPFHLDELLVLRLCLPVHSLGFISLTLLGVPHQKFGSTSSAMRVYLSASSGRCDIRCR